MRRIVFFVITIMTAILVHPAGGTSYAGQFGWTKVQIEPTAAKIDLTASDGLVRVHVEEMLPNLCYRPAPVRYEVDLENRRVFLSDYAFVQEGVMCGMMVTPMSRTIELGMLPPGEWELWISDSEGKRQKADEFVVQ